MLIKRGKLYEVPPSDGRDIKDLFLYAVERGIGQIVDSKGIPKNKWTPNTLANAISEIDHPDASVDLRTVQYWFDSKNKRNVSTTNCRWLAQVFGCGSPDEISDWQTALLSARRVFIEGRGLDGDQSINGHNEGHEVLDTSIQPPKVRRRRQIPARLEALFADPVTPSVVVWFWLTGILFLAALLGVLSVTYTTPDGTNKQVGYLWSPSWIIHDLVLLPFFLMTVSRTINFWKTDTRMMFLNDERRSPQEGWLDKVSSLSMLLWLAIAISVFFVFLLQWVGGYLTPILRNELGNTAVSWPIIILARPDIMSVGAALALSGIYIFFAALVFFFLNAGFVFLYAVWSDFSDLFKQNNNVIRADDAAKMRFVGVRLVENIFLGTILALWISTSIKL
ncbi:hypothetical protein QTO30_20190, partial [Yoonia sp. GPGPB17]|uniref:hypothetical protein n=1 Tax=Yoonia sp. GPGPB17 TaxID=3026147 RepID=UPI0030C0D6BD